MKNKQMVLGVGLGNNFGIHPGAWRMPHADPGAYTDMDVTVKHVRAAERGGIQFAFLSERHYLHGDLAAGPPVFNMDPIITMAAVAQATDRIGLVGTASTSFTEPYILARQLKALDVMSRGRFGWNAVPSYEPDAFANFGSEPPPRERKYERLHEVMQVVHALWASWEHEAGRPDQAGMFADPAHVRPVDLRGRHVAARGPLPVPPSEQGQPVVVQPASSGYGLQAAAMYANVVLGMPSTIEEGQAQRDTIRQAVASVGRDPDEVVYVAFTGYTVGHTLREALDTRRSLDDRADRGSQLSRLRAMIGLQRELGDPELAISPDVLATARAYPGHAPAARAVELARSGWSPRDILAHGVLDPYPSVVGTADQAADHLQEWFEAGAADGFMVDFADFHHGIDDFVDQVVPLLRQRNLFHRDYEGNTLREHLGLPAQYGLDPRLAIER